MLLKARPLQHVYLTACWKSYWPRPPPGYCDACLTMPVGEGQFGSCLCGLWSCPCSPFLPIPAVRTCCSSMKQLLHRRG